jgi:hypothetical protein
VLVRCQAGVTGSFVRKAGLQIDQVRSGGHGKAPELSPRTFRSDGASVAPWWLRG